MFSASEFSTFSGSPFELVSSGQTDQQGRRVSTSWAYCAVNIPLLRLGARPENVDLFFDGGEVFVAGGEGGFAVDGEGGGEAVGIGEFVIGAEIGGGAR